MAEKLYDRQIVVLHSRTDLIKRCACENKLYGCMFSTSRKFLVHASFGVILEILVARGQANVECSRELCFCVLVKLWKYQQIILRTRNHFLWLIFLENCTKLVNFLIFHWCIEIIFLKLYYFGIFFYENICGLSARIFRARNSDNFCQRQRLIFVWP